MASSSSARGSASSSSSSTASATAAGSSRSSAAELTTVLVDAENVRRSQWPNMSEHELVELVRVWAKREGVRAVVVFDGGAPTEEERDGVVLVRTGDETADDWIAREAGRFSPHWLVTSDRELRQRAAEAERIIGGGGFLRKISGR